MDLKNIIAAIALSAAVIVIYGLFYGPTQQEIDNLSDPDPLKKENNIISETPSIEENVTLSEITREDALKSTDRIIFENQYIKGSIALDGGIIDDLELKTYNKFLSSEEKIQLLNPSLTNEAYTFNTGWATKSNIATPKSNTVWKIDGPNKLTPNNPIKIYF